LLPERDVEGAGGDGEVVAVLRVAVGRLEHELAAVLDAEVGVLEAAEDEVHADAGVGALRGEDAGLRFVLERVAGHGWGRLRRRLGMPDAVRRRAPRQSALLRWGR